MRRQSIINRTLKVLNQLPEEKAEEISTFAEFVMKQYEEHQLAQGLVVLAEDSKTFGFLEQEEDLYSESDLKEVFNEKG